MCLVKSRLDRLNFSITCSVDAQPRELRDKGRSQHHAQCAGDDASGAAAAEVQLQVS